MAKRDLKSFPRIWSVRGGGVRRDQMEEAYGRLHSDLAEVARSSGAVVINPMDYLCTPDCDGVDSEGQPRYKDGFHLRASYVRRKAEFIDVTVR
jgi:hypothetical protein